MAYQLTEAELTAIRDSLGIGLNSDVEGLKLALVRLAHDGSDQAMDILREARSRIPSALRGFFGCAWDECSYFNFLGKVDEVCLPPEELAGLLALPDTAAEVAECEALEDLLADRGVIVELISGTPIQVRLAYVRRLLDSLGELRYRGTGFVHFDGCAGSCDKCIQRTWCDVPDKSA